MKLECLKDKLQRGVYLTEKMTGRNLSLTVLSNILLSASSQNKQLIIRATNLDIGIEVKIPALVAKDGVLAVKPGILGNFINNLKEEKISLEAVNNNININTKSGQTVIKCESADDFPIIPVINKGNKLTIPAIDLINGLRSVFFAASSSDIKPEISSVYIYQENHNLIFVATDSFRLAEIKIPLDNKSEFNPVILPFKNISEIIRVFDNSQGNIDIYSDKNQISFHTDELFLTSRIIDGVYPDYRQIIPKQFKTKIIINKEEFISALKISNIFLDRFNQISFSVDNKGLLTIKSQNQEIGENSITLPSKIDNEGMSINLNARYLSEVLNLITGEVIINFNEPNKPLFIQGSDNNNFSYIVMPLNR
ncbi:MAG: DNA polymerase III subunit beta [Candidatus Paceibacterota bacterium]